MKNLALQKIQEMKIYNPPLSGRRSFGGILLDFNERTLPVSSKVQEAIVKLLKQKKLQLYPEYSYLEKKLAKYVGVNKDQIMTTNGSDQAIDLIFRAFTQTGDRVIIPTPSFAMFSQCAQIAGNKIIRPLYRQDDLSFPLNELLGQINDTVKLIVICNPNNPTGTSVAIENIEKIAQKAPGAIILIDEAYFEFSKITAVPLIRKYPNIIVVRTMSKAFGLSSLRTGYIVASRIYIAELLKVRGPYDVNMVAYTASLAALGDLNKAKKYADEVMSKAKPIVEEFFRKNGIVFYQSAGNFLLYKRVIEREEEILKQKGVLVRTQDKRNIENTIRLTIGTVDQMKRFIKVYQRDILIKSKLKRVAFLDRDGTLIFEPQDTFQIDSLKKLKILDGVIKGLKELIKQGYELIIISNQDGLGTTSFPQVEFDTPQNKMLDIFKENGIIFNNIFICPHLPSENCSCRKPQTGLVKNFLRKNQIDKKNSFVCGDRPTDRLFATSIKLKFVPMQTNGDFYKSLTNGGVIL